MNKRQALKFASGKCHIYKRRNSEWVSVSPWKDSNPTGPKTEGQHMGHRHALLANAANVASVALFQYLDARQYDPEYIREGYNAIYHVRERAWCDRQPTTARALLDAGIEEANRWRERALRAELIEELEHAEV